MLKGVVHEITETMTDPTQTQWFNSTGFENGDMCAWDFGPVYTSTAGRKYNTCFPNGLCYLLQTNWLRTGNCALTAP